MSKDSLTVASMNVSRETLEKLDALCGLISKWTKSINLISPGTVNDIWDRHIVDSAQLYQHAGLNWKNWVDLGSGGGLPGLVIAILDPDERPITLMESDVRKCLFLNTVRRELNINVQVVNKRIEEASIEPADILTARALAPLTDLLEHAEKHLAPTGIALFQKGVKYQEELDVAEKNWHLTYEALESVTNPDARILKILRIARREV